MIYENKFILNLFFITATFFICSCEEPEWETRKYGEESISIETPYELEYNSHTPLLSGEGQKNFLVYKIYDFENKWLNLTLVVMKYDSSNITNDKIEKMNGLNSGLLNECVNKVVTSQSDLIVEAAINDSIIIDGIKWKHVVKLVSLDGNFKRKISGISCLKNYTQIAIVITNWDDIDSNELENRLFESARIIN